MSLPYDLTQLAFFGDSLSDDGNLYALGAGVLPESIRDALAGPTGAVSDGPTHAFLTGVLTGLPARNYAVAAAQAVGGLTLGELVAGRGLEDSLLVPPGDPILSYDINLGAQVDRFLADHGGEDLSTTPALVLIGANDYGDFDTAAPFPVLRALALVGQVTTAIAEAAGALSDAGLGLVAVSTLPDPTFLPGHAGFGAVEQDLARLLVATHNAQLAAKIGDLALSGARVSLLDLRPLTDALVEDPTGFGLLAPYGQTQTGSDVLARFDPDQVAFHDDLHPTTATHGLIASYNVHLGFGGAVRALSEADDAAAYGGRADLVFGMAGADAIRGGAGADLLFGGSGDDTLKGEGGDDLSSGGAGNDTIIDYAGADILAGGPGDDLLTGGRDEDVLIDGPGSDDLRGQGGDDVFIFVQAELQGGVTGTDADRFLGGPGDDTLYAVLDGPAYDALGGAADAADLAALGLTLIGVETIVTLEERDALATLSGEAWFGKADFWGLV